MANYVTETLKKNIYDNSNSQNIMNMFDVRIIDYRKNDIVNSDFLFLSDYLPIILTSKGYFNILSDYNFIPNIELGFPNEINNPVIKESYINQYISFSYTSGIEKKIGTFDYLKKFKEEKIKSIEDILYYKNIFNNNFKDLKREDIEYQNIFSNNSEEIKPSDFPNIYRTLEYPYIYINFNSNDDNIVYLTGYYKKNNFKIYKVDLNKTNIEVILNMLENKVLTPFIELYISYSSLSTNTKLYKTFYVPKKDGTKRKISEPIEEIKKPCKNILYFMNKAFNKKLAHKNSRQYAYIEKCGIRDNVMIHMLNDKVIKFDISKFFDNCKFCDFRHYLEFYYKDCNAEVKIRMYEILHDVLIDKETGGLYMGNPLSGVLSNMIMHKCAYYMNNMAKTAELEFSMYADDITFSGSSDNKNLNISNCKKIIQTAFYYYDLGFKINDDKTRILHNNGRRITGIRINHENHITPDRKNYMLMKSICEHLKNGKPITMNKNELQGKLSFYLYIDTSMKFKKLVNKYIKELNNYGVIIPEKYIDEDINN